MGKEWQGRERDGMWRRGKEGEKERCWTLPDLHKFLWAPVFAFIDFACTCCYIACSCCSHSSFSSLLDSMKFEPCWFIFTIVVRQMSCDCVYSWDVGRWLIPAGASEFVACSIICKNFVDILCSEHLCVVKGVIISLISNTVVCLLAPLI